MLKIKHGSVFDEKCDLLILPCSSGGTVTSWVSSEITQNNLPFPSRNIAFGKVRFLSTEARYSKADFIGYASSVNADNVSSNLTAIRSICKEILNYCTSNQCTIANLPILGTGAGGLDPSEVLALYREVLASDAVTFNIYTPDRNIERSLQGWAPEAGATNDPSIEHPRVFISYSWKDESVKDWTLQLAKLLRANGVDARLDRFHLRPGMDLPQWMTNEVLKASKVLLVCDSHYAEKADMRKAGVGWETMIIQGDMMLQGEMNTKYIVIAYGDFEKNTPIYMKSKLGISKIEVDNDLNKLLEHIFEIDSAPEIGAIPKWVRDKLKHAKPN